MTYTTYSDALNYHIIPSLGDYADDYDWQNIFNKAFEYDEQLGGFVCTVDDDEYWRIVANSEN